MTLVARTDSVEATRDVGAALAELAEPGDLILLAGDLGAGKTAFTQGFGRGLGIEERITSPTFTLAREYDGGRLLLHHIDVYRLEQLEDIFDVGLPELLDDGGAILVEWGDVVAPAMPPDFLEVRMAFGDGDDDRLLVFAPTGTRWQARTRLLGDVLSRWLDKNGEEAPC
jgi:tRNA threonylcarbamoyladenosine biosynthesis protein TsaE